VAENAKLMKKSDNLHQLIHSLTKAEKRSFKLYAAQHTKNDNSNYILLFDAIEKQKIYDERKLKEKLKKYSFSKNLSRTRHLLYHLILRTLRHLDESKDLIGKLSVLQHDVRVLISKAMYEQAYLQLQKAERIARESGLNNVLLEILDDQRKVLPYTSRRNINKKLVALAEDRVRLVRQYGREVEYRSLLDSITLLYSTIDFEILPRENNVIEAIWKNHYLNDDRQAESFLSQIYYYEIQSLVAQSKYDFILAVEVLEKARKLWIDQRDKVDVFRDDFIRITAAYVMCCISGGQRCDNFDEILDELRWMAPVSRQLATRNFFLTSALDFIHSITKKNIENCKVQLFTVKDLVDQHIDKISLNWKIILFYHIAIYHFLNKDFDEVLLWISKIKAFEKTDIYPHIHNYSKLLSLMAQYELASFETLKEDVEKTYKYLEKRKGVKEVEHAVLNCVRKLLKARHDSDTRGAFSGLKNSLLTIEANKTPLQLLTSNVLHHWVSHRLQDEDIAILN